MSDTPHYDQPTIVCVDFETSTNVKGRHDSILTVGACAIAPDARLVDSLTIFYARVEGPHHWDDDTRDWWASHEDETPEAFIEIADSTLERMDSLVALQAFDAWVRGLPSPSAPQFCSAPIQFDWGFMAAWYEHHDLPTPFHHRTVDTRSMAVGRGELEAHQSMSRLSFELTGVRPPAVPHHALDDAMHLAAHTERLLGWV